MDWDPVVTQALERMPIYQRERLRERMVKRVTPRGPRGGARWRHGGASWSRCDRAARRKLPASRRDQLLVTTSAPYIPSCAWPGTEHRYV